MLLLTLTPHHLLQEGKREWETLLLTGCTTQESRPAPHLESTLELPLLAREPMSQA